MALATPLFGVALLASLPLLVHPWFEQVRDAAIYIGGARSLAHGDGYSYLGVPFVLRPPGLSTLLLPVVSFFDSDFWVFNLYISLFGVVGVLLFHQFLRQRVGWGLALLTSTALWLNPAYRQLCNQVMSDVPGFALLVGCLLLERWTSRRHSAGREVLLGIAIGLSAYVRSANLLLLPAILGARLLQRWRSGDALPIGSFVSKHLLVVAVSAWLVTVPWSVRNHQVKPPSPADQVYAYDYSTGMWHEDPGDPSSPTVGITGVLERIPKRLRQFSDVLGSRMQLSVREGSPSVNALSPVHAATTALLLAGLLYVLVKRREAAEIFALLSLCVLSVYFGFIDRLVLPVYALSLGATVELLHSIGKRVLGRSAATLAVAGAVCLLIAIDWNPRRNWPEIESTHQMMSQNSRDLEEKLDPEARVASAHGFFYSVYLKRPVYSLSLAVRRAGQIDAVEQVIDRYGIDTVVLSTAIPAENRLLGYIGERYEAVARAGTRLVFSVREPKRDTQLPQRVVLITLDTLRQDAFRRPGDTPTPLAKTLARARHGLIFESYYSVTSSTQPSHATMFTGLQPWQHGVTKNGAVLDAGYETVAERLKAEGFRTAAAVSSFAVDGQFGFAQGFDHYFADYTQGSTKTWMGVERNSAAFSSTAEVVSRRAIRFLDELGGDKQFFWFHFFDAHAPYGDRELTQLTPRKLLREILDDKAEPDAVLARARDLYDSDVRFLDRHLDALMEKIARDRSDYETHLVVVSDHGESFGEQGSMGHGRRLTEATLRVPLFVLSPSVTPGVRSDPVGTVDLAATLLALAGSSAKLGDSRNFLDPAAPAHPVVGMRRTYETPYEERRLDGSVHTFDGPEFYAVEEGQIVVGDRQGLTASDMSSLDASSGSEERLVLLFSQFEATLRTSKEVGATDEETLEKLKALGYVP